MQNENGLERYIVASCREWNRPLFEERSKALSGTWHYVASPDELDQALAETKPRYIFFLHWNDLVPERVSQAHECVCFHMTDVPYGRGGSPLQNLIMAGKTETKLSALRMVEELDAGPVYLKCPMDLHGSAEEIYKRCTNLSWDMIDEITATNPAPVEQSGEVVTFKRRTPSQSKLPDDVSLHQMHDHIRMLDAPGYPHAFVEHGGFHIEFTDSKLEDGEIRANVTIRKRDGGNA